MRQGGVRFRSESGRAIGVGRHMGPQNKSSPFWKESWAMYHEGARGGGGILEVCWPVV